MVQRFSDHIVSLLGTPNKHRFLLGVSGGVDSVAVSYTHLTLPTIYSV